LTAALVENIVEICLVQEGGHRDREPFVIIEVIPRRYLFNFKQSLLVEDLLLFNLWLFALFLYACGVKNPHSDVVSAGSVT